VKDCCHKNLPEAVKIGRANYVCPVCQSNVSLAHVFYMDTVVKSKHTETGLCPECNGSHVCFSVEKKAYQCECGYVWESNW
jgi:hypothetical protein